MNEFLIIIAFLFPVVWYFGYRNGKKQMDKKANKRRQGLSKTYFTGLNYLLNEESNKAIDTFASMLEVDSETLETHLALGSLFRKRGEVDKAIRIHQNLIARPSLSTEDKNRALLELGYDYLSAGLLDRAENIFKELSNDFLHKDTALAKLLTIYQQTKDWQKAIATAAQVSRSGNPQTKTEITHFYCELAEELLQNKSYKEAINYIKKAIQVDTKSVRATLISGQIHYSRERYKKAIKSFNELAKRDIAFLPEALPLTISSYLQLKDKQGLFAFLQNALNSGAGISTILAYAELLQSESGDKAAAEFIAKQMNTHPSIRGLYYLIDLHIEHASDTAKPSLVMLQQIVAKLLQNKAVYHCYQCGFDSKSLFWQCPSCAHWGSVKPIQGIEGE
ncbi:MAG: lipopolysaccharide assembly protein LapB [Kangiellaceae bacterium]